MSHRVIAGTAKGRRLKLVPGDSTRPIMDRAKEALFSILGTEVIGISMLDLFAGTGAVGIEALSRGAAHVTFFDMDKHAIQTIYENLKITGFTQQASVRRVDSLATLRQTPLRPFDLIYIAPPQYKEMWQKALIALDEHPAWMHEDTIVIVQIDPKEESEIQLKNLIEYDQRRYGKTLLWFFEVGQPDSDETSGDIEQTEDKGSTDAGE